MGGSAERSVPVVEVTGVFGYRNDLSEKERGNLQDFLNWAPGMLTEGTTLRGLVDTYWYTVNQSGGYTIDRGPLYVRDLGFFSLYPMDGEVADYKSSLTRYDSGHLKVMMELEMRGEPFNETIEISWTGFSGPGKGYSRQYSAPAISVAGPNFSDHYMVVAETAGELEILWRPPGKRSAILRSFRKLEPDDVLKMGGRYCPVGVEMTESGLLEVTFNRLRREVTSGNVDTHTADYQLVIPRNPWKQV